MNEPASITERLESILQGNNNLQDRLQTAIEAIAGQFEARTCTFHRTTEEGAFLELVAHVGLPPHIAEIAGRIPFGKGMAGICAQRREPVTMCNLQTDDSGDAKPAARDTRVEGALVVPLIIEDWVSATLGVGKATDYDYSEDEIEALVQCAATLMSALS